MQVSAFRGEKKSLTRYAWRGSFSACNWGGGGQLCKNNPPFWQQWKKSRAKPWHLCTGSGGSFAVGLLLLLQSDIVVPSAHMMNDSPCIGQAGSSWLCNKQRRFFELLSAQAYFCSSNPTEKSCSLFLINQFTQARKITKCLSLLLILSHHGIWLETTLTWTLHLSLSPFTAHTTSVFETTVLREKKHAWAQISFLPSLPTHLFPVKRKTKLWGILKGVHSAS